MNHSTVRPPSSPTAVTPPSGAPGGYVSLVEVQAGPGGPTSVVKFSIEVGDGCDLYRLVICRGDVATVDIETMDGVDALGVERWTPADDQQSRQAAARAAVEAGVAEELAGALWARQDMWSRMAREQSDFASESFEHMRVEGQEQRHGLRQAELTIRELRRQLGVAAEDIRILREQFGDERRIVLDRGSVIVKATDLLRDWISAETTMTGVVHSREDLIDRTRRWLDRDYGRDGPRRHEPMVVIKVPLIDGDDEDGP